MSFEKNLNTFKTSLLNAGGATSKKQHLIQITAACGGAWTSSDDAYAAAVDDACAADDTYDAACAAARDAAWTAYAPARAALVCDDVYAVDAAFDAAFDATDADAYAAAAFNIPSSSFFFKPYKSPLDFVTRVTTIVSAPIALSFLAIEQLFEFLVLGLKSLVGLVRHGKFEGEEPKEALVKSVHAFLIAIVSPLLNTGDVIGSLIASGLNKPNDEQENAPALGLNH